MARVKRGVTSKAKHKKVLKVYPLLILYLNDLLTNQM